MRSRIKELQGFADKLEKGIDQKFRGMSEEEKDESDLYNKATQRLVNVQVEIDNLGDDLYDANEKYLRERNKLASKVIGSLQVENPHQPKFQNEEITKTEMETIEKFYSTVYSGTNEDVPPIRTEKNFNRRSSYKPSSHTLSLEKVSFFREEDDPRRQSTAIHEYAHGIEVKHPGVMELTNQFVEYRVGNEVPTLMKDVVPDLNYEDNEIGRKNSFDKATGSEKSGFYVGKVYPNGSTEVLTMGCELLFKDPIGFAKSDPEWYAFTVGILDGSLLKG